MPRKHATQYIRITKRFHHPVMIDRLTILAQDWGMSTQEVCYKIIEDGVKEIFFKRRQLGEDLKK